MGDSVELALTSGSRVGVIGGGPAGSFFSYFLLSLAQRVDIDIQVTIYESRDFSTSGPTGCNMCAGVVSESLIQALSIEGINLPSDVVQKGINSFVMHTDMENVTMYTPFHEMRIATVYRGGGPNGTREPKWRSFDDYILKLAADLGAKVFRGRVTDIGWDGERPRVYVKEGGTETYDLIVGAVGINSPTVALFEKLGIGYRRPKARKAYITELALGSDFVNEKLGNSMHVFMLDLPNLDCAALIPKGEYVTLCLIGDNIDKKFADDFIKHPAFQACLGENNCDISGDCSCFPNFSLGDAIHPFSNRVLLIGDCGMSRFNKDGIGSAYRTAKAAAVTALFRGISSRDFYNGYWPVCRDIHQDNRFGRIIYRVVNWMKRNRFFIRGIVRMIKNEQNKRGRDRRMSMALWNMFTGSAYYRNVFLKNLRPSFIGRFFWNIFFNSGLSSVKGEDKEDVMENGDLGRMYRGGEVIIRQGEPGECMYVIQKGRAEVLYEKGDDEIRLAILGKGDVFGEMALFQKKPRSATVRALGDVRVLTVDKRVFLRRVHEDPSFAYKLLQEMSKRISELDAELVGMKTLA